MCENCEFAFCPGKRALGPLSRSFFARCGIPRTSTSCSRRMNPKLRASRGLEVTKIGLWYPTSREKRARYGGPPRICGQDRNLFGNYVLTHPLAPGACFPARSDFFRSLFSPAAKPCQDEGMMEPCETNVRASLC